jgi:RND family efflux transporter MFP subunit
VLRRLPYAVLASVLAACGGTAPPPAPAAPPKVGVLTLHAQDVPIATELPGRIVAHRIAEVRPQVNGVLLKRLFVEGSEVKAGQQLYQIDPAPYQAAYDSAAAAATSARLTAERYKPLAEVNAVSKMDYDNAVATDLQARATLETAQINLNYTKVLAPISGRIGRSSVTEGALVAANQATALAVVQQLDPLYVDASEASSTMVRLRRELAAGALQHSGEAAVSLKLEDGSDYALPGKLEFSEVMVDQGTGSVTLRSLFANPERLLLPGMFVHERIVEGVRANALLVPQQAVTHDPKGNATALVVLADNKVAIKTIVTDRAIGDQWLVTDGLKAGDRVIVEGLQYAKPGAAVEPSEVQPPPQGGAVADRK